MTRRRVSILFLLSLTAIALYFCYVIARPFIMPVITAMVLAIAFYPIHAKLIKRLGNHNAAALLSTLLVILVIIVPAILIGVAVARELTDMYSALSQQSAEEGGWVPWLLQVIERPVAWVGRYVDLSTFDLRKALLSRIEQASATLMGFAADSLSNVTSLVVNSVVTFFTLFFLFREGRNLRRRAEVVLPLDEKQIATLFDGIDRTITASLYGSLSVALAQGSLTGIAFWALGLPSPILWGVVAAMFSLIPMVGSGIVWLPAALLLLANGSYGRGIILLIIGTALIGTIDNLLRPYVMSGQVQLPTLLLFFAIFGGIQAFGIIGLFIGPIVLAVTMTLFGLLREESPLWGAPRKEGKRAGE